MLRVGVVYSISGVSKFKLIFVLLSFIPSKQNPYSPLFGPHEKKLLGHWVDEDWDDISAYSCRFHDK